mgnify:CR=1 FL=1
MELYGNQIHCFDEIDRLTVDFILSKNEKPVFNKLENIGYVFYGPLIFYFMVWMINNLYKNKADKVFFNTREGYFLLKSYEFVKTIIGSENLPEGIYFKTSRRMATVPAIFNEEDIYESIKLKGPLGVGIHRFNGTFEQLLNNRFGVKIDDSDKNKNKHIDTTHGLAEAHNCLKRYIDKILKNSSEERKNYLSYIDSICKKEDKIVMVDHGIHGTSQMSIEKITNRKFIGNYLCVNKNSNPYEFDDIDSFYDYDLGYLKYMIAFMESTFTAPEGMYVKCDGKGGFINDRIWSNQAVFQKKIQIFNGVKSFILDMLYEILTVKGLKLNNKLPDFIFMLIESPKMVIEDNIRKIFYLDNQFVTEGEKSIKFSNGDTKCIT